MKIVFYLFVIGVTIGCRSVKPKNKFTKTRTYLYHHYHSQNTHLPYRILYPDGYDGVKKYPVLFFLHGSGERGNDNEKQLVHGSKLFLDSLAKYPCIVIFPQCDTGDYWANISRSSSDVETTTLLQFESIEKPGPSTQALLMLIDSFLNDPAVDPSRIYLAGLSMGGMGTAQLLATRPSTFAAATVICGAAPLDFKVELSKTPTQLYHGSKDPVVHPNNSEAYYRAIKDSMHTHRLILYPEVDHQSWNNAFSESDFLSWIFSHQK